MYDVVVVGGGPAGSAAAKKCAEHGFKTLLLEKRQLPRDKVCSGMIVGPVAHTLIKQEFGEIPKTVLSEPAYLAGFTCHVPGIGSEKLDNFISLTWRRNLDYWMNQKAQDKGVEMWQGARVVGLKPRDSGFSIEIEKDKGKQELEARYVIGADGANSIVRRLLFPELKARYSQVYQEHYKGKLDLDNRYFNWFYPVEYSPVAFTVHHKNNLIVVDVSGRIGQMKELMHWVKDFLAKNYHFDIGQRPVWRGSCLEPVLYRELTSHTFLPARGNALLVGDAAGFIMPVSGEGMGTGIKSGLLAASSIARAVESGEPPHRIYLTGIEGIISLFQEVTPWFKRMSEEAKGGGHSLAQVSRDAHLSTLKMF